MQIAIAYPPVSAPWLPYQLLRWRLVPAIVNSRQVTLVDNTSAVSLLTVQRQTAERKKITFFAL